MPPASPPIRPTTPCTSAEAVRFKVWEEACPSAATAFLGQTGICPVTQCAKSLVNGPCGGQKNGKCEVNPENDCAWIKIYKRLREIGQLDKLRPPHEVRTRATRSSAIRRTIS